MSSITCPDDDSKMADKQFSDKYNFQDGDIELVSSCSVHFRVHSYQLRAASSVFRSMFDIGDDSSSHHSASPQEIVLTDEEFETAPVVNAFLDILYKGEPQLQKEDDIARKVINYTLLKQLVRFVEKYDAILPRFVLKGGVGGWLLSEMIGSDHAFVLSSILGDK
ncbi:hypothetical protein IAT38_003314 [Cryptococcus sp. DSM 104549]